MAKKIHINKNRSGETESASIYDSPIELPQDFGVIPTSGIVKREDGSLELSNIRIHRVGLEFVNDISEEEYEIFGQTLLQIDTAYQWIVGDYLAYGVENNYGKISELAEKLGKSEQTVTNWVYVSRHVEFYRRRENLSHGHHDAVASLTIEKQNIWLEKAEIGNGKAGDAHKIWSVKKLRREIATSKGEVLSDTVKIPKYEKLQERSYEDVSNAISYFHKSTDEAERLGWKIYIENAAKWWGQALNDIQDN